MPRKVKAKDVADRQLEDFSPAVLAAFIRQEFAVPFALDSDRLWQKLLRVEAEMEMEKNRAEVSRLIEENKDLIARHRHSDFIKNNKRIDALWNRNEKLMDVAYPNTARSASAGTPEADDASL